MNIKRVKAHRCIYFKQNHNVFGGCKNPLVFGACLNSFLDECDKSEDIKLKRRENAN